MAAVTVIKRFFGSKEEAIADIKNERKPGDSFEPHCHANDERLVLWDADTARPIRGDAIHARGDLAARAVGLDPRCQHVVRTDCHFAFTRYPAV